MSDITKFNNLKRDLDNIRTRKIQIETDLKNLEAEKAKLLQECKALNVDPKNIEGEITTKTAEIETLTTTIKKGMAELGQALN